ncbi:MAG: sulfurtransferase TusA family protein [Desulfuromonas sp.]|nr:MAG: sulfurtransferase TusA family protein [Desulfuromonas sp.]
MASEIIEIDIRGQVCPSSLLLALKEINRQHQLLTSGKGRILVMTDNRDAIATIPAAVENMGFGADVEKKDGYYRILVGN